MLHESCLSWDGHGKFGKGKTKMNARLLAVAIAASLSSAVVADTILLDIPDGIESDIIWTSGGGAKSPFFEISSQNLNFWDSGYGTPGVVYAWDIPNLTNATGILDLTAIDPSTRMLSSVTFDLSGYLTEESNSMVRVYADNEMIFEDDFSFAGADGLETISLNFTAASNVRIELDNTSPWAWTGLDNILVTSMAVPAPGALAAFAVVGLGRRRRRNG
jgi:MYXO-CTERM domain-containing protein